MGIKKNWYKANRAPEVGVEEFFERHDMTNNIQVFKPLSKGKKFAKISGSLLGFVCLSTILGVLLSLLPLSLFAAGTIASEPAVQAWKELPAELPEITIAERNVMYDKNGKVFAQVWSENRVRLDSLDSVSEHAINALVATEDKRFYTHNGFDPIGTARSAIKQSGGGSGITQQLIKNLQFYNQAGDTKEEAVEQTISRKIKELKLALEYEKTHSKDEILLEYFNTVAFGGPNIYSIQAASQYFFGKDAKGLDIAEASALVGSVQNTVIFNLEKEEAYDKWKQRQKEVLGRMLAEGNITKKEYDDAVKQKLTFKLKAPNGNCTSSAYPFYCEYVLDYMKNNDKLGATEEERAAVLAKGGLHIETYLDPKELKVVEKTLKTNFGKKNRVIAPVAIVEPGTGGLTSIGVNRDYGEGKGETTYVTSDIASGTGSTYKLITLAAALANGFEEEDLEFSSACPWMNPNFDFPKGGVKNSSSCALQGGMLDYKHATAYSSNTWFTELISRVGVEKVKEFSASIGLSAPESIGKRSVSYTLGVTANSTIDMAAAFATFSNGGVYCPPTPVKDFAYSDGSRPAMSDTYDPEQEACKRVLSPKDSSIVLKAMRANVSGEIEDSFGLKGAIKGYDAVGKTGTNQLYNLTWAQVTAERSLFVNVHDMKKLTNGVGTITYKGQPRPWNQSAAMDSGVEIMKTLLEGTKNVKLDYDNTDDSFVPVQIDKRDFFTVPSVIGMTPESAVASLETSGLKVQILKETEKSSGRFPSGVILEQSVPAGTELAVGTKREIILVVSE